jgi:hypothetical protein
MDEATPSLSTPTVANALAAGALVPHAAAACDGCAPVRFTPADIARRDVVHWTGVDAETIELVRREPYEYQLQGSCHLLVMAERAERDDGETRVEGLPTSTLRKFSGMLSFVPRGHRLSGWQKPRVLTRVTYFYIDPDGPLLDPALRFAETEFKPRLFFHDAELWAIASKLKAQAENPSPGQQQYARRSASCWRTSCCGSTPTAAIARRTSPSMCAAGWRPGRRRGSPTMWRSISPAMCCCRNSPRSRA